VLPTQFEDKLLRFIDELCRKDGLEPFIEPDTPLFTGGLIDSRRVVDLMEFVEREFATPIPDHLLSMEHFASVREIVRKFASSAGMPPPAPATIEEPLLVFGRPKRTPDGEGMRALTETRQVITGGDGCVVLAGDALALHAWFCARFAAMAASEGAAPRRYPTLLPLADLERTDYFKSFPQHATFCTCLGDDRALLRGFVADVKEGHRVASAAERRMERPARVLSSAVCYHCYREFAGRVLPDTGSEPMVLTAEGRCFRNERGAFDGLNRCYEFTMREIVFIGDADAVEQRRVRLMQRVIDLAEVLGLGGCVQRATDLFFKDDVEGRARALHQSATALKYELRARLDGEGRTLAIASFNVHEDYFGRAFEIRLPDRRHASTGCVAFGIERWVSAFVAHHGADPARWPQSVRQAVAAHG
jgi:seryl-tRNA synthetase/acyl carrier protein